MRQLIVAATVLVALALVAVPTASAQMGGFGGLPFGAPPFGGLPFGGPFMGGRVGFPPGAPGSFGMPGVPGGYGVPGAPGAYSMAGALGGYGRGMPGSATQSSAPGVPGAAAAPCTDSQGNPLPVPSGGAASANTNCAPTGVNANATCTGPFTATLAPTSQGGGAVGGTLSFSQPSNGQFTLTGTLTGVSENQTITLTIPLTSNTTAAATTVVPAGSTSVTFGGSMSGTPAYGGTVTVAETSQPGNLAQGTVSGTCSGGALGSTAPPAQSVGAAPSTGGGPTGVAVGQTGSASPPPAGMRCTDSQGNTVLVPTGGATTGYTNCTTQ